MSENLTPHGAQRPAHYVRVVALLAMGTSAALAGCGTSAGMPDVTVGGGGVACSCALPDGGSSFQSQPGGCTPDELDAGCHTLYGGGPLAPPELPERA